MVTITQGERIKEIRKTRNLTLEKFGQKIGVTKSTISRIEKSERRCTEQMIKLICAEYKVSEDWLRYGEGGMYMPEEKRSQIEDFMTDVSQLDEQSFEQLKFVVSILVARERQVRLTKEKESVL